MATGFLKVIVSAASGNIPIGWARVTILNGEIILYELATDESGSTAPIPLETPPADFSLVPMEEEPYSTYTARIEAEGFGTVIVRGVEILGGETSILPVNMKPGGDAEEIIIPPHDLVGEKNTAPAPVQARSVDNSTMGFFPLDSSAPAPRALVAPTADILIPYPGVVLRRGMNGPSIRQVQERLNTLGTSPRLTTDGIFGPLTEAAVIQFQRSRNLTADGVVGPLTWTAMFTAPAVPPPPIPPPPPPIVNPPYPGVVLMRGMSGPSISQVQARLNTLGANPRLATDGIFGPLTEAAVIAFQRRSGLTPDGIVGRLTWNALFAGNQPPPIPPSPPPPPPPPPPSRVHTIVLDPGHGGFDSGAVGFGRRESDDNLRMAQAVGSILRAQGQRVIMTRDNDTSVTLGERSAISNRNNTDMFVSIHRNAFTNPAANGVENFVSTNAPARTAQFAQNVLNRIVAVGVQSNRGLKRENFAVLRNTNAPAMLLELGFITNQRDNQLFDQHFDAYANAIAHGIMESLNS